MSSRSPSDLIEATRLTRSGRLAEATALLRRGLSGLVARDGAESTGGRAPWRPRIFDGALPTPNGTMTPPSLDRLKGAAAWRPSEQPGGTVDAKVSADPRSKQARFEERRFVSPAGSRPYKVFVPTAHSGGRPLPLIVMLHGCTQSPDDFAAGTRMNEIGEKCSFLVVYPEQTKAANAARCWNWFNEADRRRDGGEAAVIAGITHQVIEEFATDPKRVYVAGLSAGGATAAIMGAVYPELYAAVGVHSGLACGAARDVPSAFAAMKHGGHPAPGGLPRGPLVPTIVFHGDADRTVNPVNGAYVAEQSTDGTSGLSAKTEHGRSKGGMDFSRTVQRQGDRVVGEQWVLHGAGHAWSGGSPDGTYTDPRGPDASREMVRFFLEASRPGPGAQT